MTRALTSFAALIAILLIAVCGFAQTPAASPPAGTEQRPSLKILMPHPGEQIPGTFVTVKYEVSPIKTGHSSSLTTFQLKLDGHDTIQTIDREHTFTGLTAGAHNVTVDVLDPNGAPVSGAHSEIEFIVIGAGEPTHVPDHSDALKTARLRRHHAAARIHVALAAYALPATDLAPDEQQQLPQSSSALPLLSVVGLGALLGGIASARKTR
jgi:hypothetical protein